MSVVFKPREWWCFYFSDSVVMGFIDFVTLLRISYFKMGPRELESIGFHYGFAVSVIDLYLVMKYVS